MKSRRTPPIVLPVLNKNCSVYTCKDWQEVQCVCAIMDSTTLSTPSPLPHYPTTNPTHTSMVKGSTKQCWHCKTKCLMSTIGACKPRRRCDTDTRSEGIRTCVDWTFVIKASMAAAFNIPFDAAPMAAGTCDDVKRHQGKEKQIISALLNTHNNGTKQSSYKMCQDFARSREIIYF